MEYGFAHGGHHMAFMEQARAYEVAVEELVHLRDGFALEVSVFHRDAHEVWLYSFVVVLLFVEFLLFFLCFYVADVPYRYCGSDDSEHAERVGAGVT